MRRPAAPRVWMIAIAAAVVFANALAVVYSAAGNRARYSELIALDKAHDRLVVRRGQFELEALTLAAHARVAHLAATEKKMHPPAKVRIVRVP